MWLSAPLDCLLGARAPSSKSLARAARKRDRFHFSGWLALTRLPAPRQGQSKMNVSLEQAESGLMPLCVHVCMADVISLRPAGWWWMIFRLTATILPPPRHQYWTKDKTQHTVSCGSQHGKSGLCPPSVQLYCFIHSFYCRRALLNETQLIDINCRCEIAALINAAAKRPPRPRVMAARQIATILITSAAGARKTTRASLKNLANASICWR